MASFKYALRDTFRLICRHWGLSILTLITAASVLYILGFTALFALNVRHMVSQIEGGLVVQVYMKKGEKPDDVYAKVKTNPTVTNIRAISPEEALDRLRAKLGNQARAVTLMGENPLPWSLEIQVQRAEHITPLVRDLVVFPSVEEVIYSGKLVERLLYRDPNSGQVCKGVDEIPFYTKQQRTVLGNCGIIDPENLDEYRAWGGYEAARKAFTALTPEEVCKEMVDSGLRGRGGGGFPTGLKWQLTLKEKSNKK
ncbi:MAG: hypothetical protein EOM65_11680, partial [Synergistales bacterium]|nr:hypothetical protein [Synergistales bacterium]